MYIKVLFLYPKGREEEGRGLLLKGGWGGRGGEWRVRRGADGRREECRGGEVKDGEGRERK